MQLAACPSVHINVGGIALQMLIIYSHANCVPFVFIVLSRHPATQTPALKVSIQVFEFSKFIYCF